jgi:hypothetical protein
MVVTRSHVVSHNEEDEVMTMKEAIEKAGHFLDGVSEKSLRDYEALLREHGATDDELRDELQRARADYAQERARCLAQAKAWLLTCCLESKINHLKGQLEVANAELDRVETTLQ